MAGLARNLMVIRKLLLAVTHYVLKIDFNVDPYALTNVWVALSPGP